MKIIVGLGNPGKKYEKNRHNLGYMTIDKLSKKLDIELNKEKFNGLIGEKTLDGDKIMLVKPLTFMNLSGDCISEILNFYKVTPSSLVVIYDDIDIDLGKIRVKPQGKPGTHNGMRDITTKIGTEDFIRVRIGSGKPFPEQNLADFVLSDFSKDEFSIIDKSTDLAMEAVIEILNSGVHSAMNKFN